MQEAHRPETARDLMSARRQVGAWLKERIEQESELDLPALTDEAVQHFWLEWSDAEIKTVFPEVLRAFVYQLGVQTIADKRPDADQLNILWEDGPMGWMPYQAKALGGWMEHVNGRYVSYAEMGSEELMQAADEREKRVMSEMETIEKLRETASGLKNGQKVRTRLQREVSPAAEDLEHRIRKDDLVTELSTDYMGEYTGFCWHCGTVINEEEPAEGYPGHNGPKCSGCGTKWARAYVSDCPTDGEGMFVHLQQPGSVQVSEDLTRVEWATGPCQCDACHNVYVYDWQLLEYIERGTWAATSYEDTDNHQGSILLYGPNSNGERIASRNTIMSDS